MNELKKPNPRDYGYEEPTYLNPGGWCYEGGEEEYLHDLMQYEKYLKEKEDK